MSKSDYLAYDHITHLEEVLKDAERVIREKDAQYAASWKSRGGVGAYMMLARKWDRIEAALSPMHLGDKVTCGLSVNINKPVAPYDIITACIEDNRTEGILDDIKDLRNYLTLVEAEVVARLSGTKKVS
jgi:hypothetical protein